METEIVHRDSRRSKLTLSRDRISVKLGSDDEHRGDLFLAAARRMHEKIGEKIPHFVRGSITVTDDGTNVIAWLYEPGNKHYATIRVPVRIAQRRAGIA